MELVLHMDPLLALVGCAITLFCATVAWGVLS